MLKSNNKTKTNKAKQKHAPILVWNTKGKIHAPIYAWKANGKYTPQSTFEEQFKKKRRVGQIENVDTIYTYKISCSRLNTCRTFWPTPGLKRGSTESSGISAERETLKFMRSWQPSYSSGECTREGYDKFSASAFAQCESYRNINQARAWPFGPFLHRPHVLICGG